MKRFILIFCMVAALSACSIKNTELTTVTTTDNKTTTEVVNTIETNVIKDSVDVLKDGAGWLWGLVKESITFFGDSLDIETE